MFVFSIHLWDFGKISIFLASSGSFNVKNDNIHSFFFSLFWLQILNFRLRFKTKIHRLDRFHGNGPYCKILTEKEPIRAQGSAEDWVCHIIMKNIRASMASKGLHPVEALIFFKLLPSNCLNWKIYCDSSLSSTTTVQCEFHIYFTMYTSVLQMVGPFTSVSNFHTLIRKGCC